MTYQQRLAYYEQKKQQIMNEHISVKEYEQRVNALAKKLNL